MLEEVADGVSLCCEVGGERVEYIDTEEVWLCCDKSDVAASENWEQEPTVVKDTFGVATELVGFAFVGSMIREFIYRLVVEQFDGAFRAVYYQSKIC